VLTLPCYLLNTHNQKKQLKLEDWDHLPYIRVYPPTSTKLHAFELSTIATKVQDILSFDEYLKLNKDGKSTELSIVNCSVVRVLRSYSSQSPKY